jgi:hypothetical protein
MNFRLIPLTLAASVIAFSVTTADATGRYTCEDVAKSKWLTQEALTKKLSDEGWAIRFMKEDGGCWEVYGTTPEGQRAEVYFNPSSGKKLLVSQRGRTLFKAE